MASWNSADVASAPGVVERKSAMMLLLPAPNSVSSRADTTAEFGIGVEPATGRQGR